MVERIVLGEAVEELGHPPGKALDLPHAADAGGGVLREKIGAAPRIKGAKRVGEDTDVGYSQVESLGAGRRDNVGCVPGEEEAAELHGLNDKAAHAGDGSLCNLTFPELPAIESCESLPQLVPDAIVGPEGEVLIGRALKIKAADFGRAHGEQREAAVVMHIDKFFGGGRRLGEDAEPAKGIVAFVDGEHTCGD